MARLGAFGAAALLAAAAGCKGKRDAAGAGTAGSAGGQPAADTAPSTAAAGAADESFLKRMTDHHEGLLLMARQASERAGGGEVSRDARALAEAQRAEQQRMLALLKSRFDESHAPAAMARHRAVADSLAGVTGRDYGPVFYQHVIAHHQEGIAMIDSLLPQLADTGVRAMAERIRDAQIEDMDELSAKVGGS
jgi:uncharacterized protein (DUF305 family)